jgi:hypothetical protein
MQAIDLCPWPALRRILADGVAEGRTKRVFDLGCGNGATARVLAAEGFEVVGVDSSPEGIAHARPAVSTSASARPTTTWRQPSGAGRSCYAWRSSSMSTSRTVWPAPCSSCASPGRSRSSPPPTTATGRTSRSAWCRARGIAITIRSATTATSSSGPWACFAPCCFRRASHDRGTARPRRGMAPVPPINRAIA